MKQGFASFVQLVEQKYGFDKCGETKFVKQLIKEFVKCEKKLVKIENYQKMSEESKQSSKRVLKFIEKKQSFLDHIASLRRVTDLYLRACNNHAEAILQAFQKQVKTEVEGKEKEFREKELQKLSNFFVVAAMFKEKDHISPTSLIKVPKEKQEVIMNKYLELTKLTHNNETTMKKEAKKLREKFIELLKNKEIESYVEDILRNGFMVDEKFKINEVPEYDFVMLQPADRLEMSDEVKAKAKTQVLIKPNTTLPHPEAKKEEAKKSGKTTGDKGVAPNLKSANQESESKKSLSKSAKRRMEQQESKCNEVKGRGINEIDKEENDKKILNHHNPFK